MRRLPFVLVLFLLAGAATPAAAQVGYGELERRYWPGAYVPYGGAGYQARYSYYPAMIETGLGYGGDFRHYEVMDLVDREERAMARASSRLLPFERMGPLFGRRCAPVVIPADPSVGPPPPTELLPPPPMGLMPPPPMELPPPPPMELPPPPPLLPPLEEVAIHTCFSVGF